MSVLCDTAAVSVVSPQPDGAAIRSVRPGGSLHTRLLDRLDQTQIGRSSTTRATEGLRSVVNVVQASKLQAGVSSAHIAAKPHLATGLGKCSEGVGTMRPRTDHRGAIRSRTAPRLLANDHYHRRPAAQI